MWKIKNLLKKWKHEFMYQLFYYAAKEKSKRAEPIFLIGTPLHGNVGDQAIAMAEYKYLEQHLKRNQNIVEIPSKYITMHIDRWERLIADNTILIHGGGFIGSLWPEEYNMIKKIIEVFNENHMVILPQTIYYNSICDEIKDFNALLAKCRYVTLCAREEISYEFALKYLPDSNPQLIPDMVTYLDSKMFQIDFSIKRSGVLLCLRDDIEKIIDDSAYDTILSSVLKYFDVNEIWHTDTFINQTVYPYQRKKIVRQKILEFSRAKLIVTDRLHGMVMAAVANTPCIVLSNCNHKVKGVYCWIKNNRYIRYIENLSEFENQIIELLATKNYNYSNKVSIEKFAALDDLINR